jgi:DHA1 family inner membrane transport protein
MRRSETLLLLTLAFIQFTNIMDFMIIMPLGNQLMKTFEIAPYQFGYIVSSYTITAGIVGFFGAFFIDNFNRKSILLACYFGFLIGTLACAFAPGFEWMMAARVLTGAFGGVLGTLVLSIVGDTIPNERRGVAMGLVTAGFAIASVFGVPFGNFLATTYSWHAPFFFIAGAGLLVSIAILIYIPSLDTHIREKEKRPDPFQVMKNLFYNLNQRRALLLMCLLMLSQFTIIPFLAAYMEKNVGFSQVQVTYIYLFGGICTVISSPLIGKLADKLGKQKVFGVFATLALVPIILITNMNSHWTIPIAIVVTSFFFIVISGRVVPAMALITSTTVPQTRGSFMSFNSSVQQLSVGIAAFIAGSIVTASPSGELNNYNMVGYIAAIACVASIWAATRITTAAEYEAKSKSSG